MKKNNSFIYFNYDSINEILKNRRLQTSEYELSRAFLKLLLNENQGCNQIENLIVVSKEQGTYCFKKDTKHKSGIVFDLDELGEFREKEEKDQILIIQKVMRFCVKFWQNLPMTSSERKIQDTSKYCLLPLPFSSTKYYKILIDTKPDEERQKKRNQDILLAFKDGHDKTPAEDEKLTNFKKAVNEIDAAYKITEDIKCEKECYDYNKFENSIKTKKEEIKGYVSFENWDSHLTVSQNNFIYNKSLSSSRIEGAAGTGKTRSLILRAIFLIKKYSSEDQPINIVFFTHSTSTKKNIENQLRYDLEENYLNRELSEQSITVTTLLEWCIENGNTRINIEDCLEPDAMDSKQMQLLLIEEIFRNIMDNEYESTYSELLSNDLKTYLNETSDYILLDSLQKEFAIFIKGQADQNLDEYKSLKKSALPVKTNEDRGFIFRLFNQYQMQIESLGQFDVDDVVLSAMGSLNTPIWKRIRNTHGFDYIILDETQLFNFNELSLLQYVNKEASKSNICFSQDISQAVGDIGFNSETFEEVSDIVVNDKYNFGTVFRCSPEIAEVAFKVLTSGPTLLTNNYNPLENIEIVANDNETVVMPLYHEFVSDEDMIKYTYKHIDALVREQKISKSDVLIIATDEVLLKKLESEGKKLNKPITFIEKRGDTSIVETVKSSGMYIGSAIEYVGGLEFEAVIIIGVDSERVPPQDNRATHFLKHAWVNKMYVAITRSRKFLEVYGNSTFNTSSLIESALSDGTLTHKTT